jgi:hypothetical protein
MVQTYSWVESTAPGFHLATSKHGLVLDKSAFKFFFGQGVLPIWMGTRAKLIG